MEKASRFFRDLLKNPEVVDVIVFGSLVKGKKNPGDTDACVIWSEKSKPVEGAISKTYEEFFSPSFLAREDMLSDGWSLRLKKPISSAFGYASVHAFSYSLLGMNYNTRARFHNAMRQKINELKLLKLKSLVLVPVSSSDNFSEFLKYWKVNYRKSNCLFPEQEFSFLKKSSR
jgi:hypothetical protein